MRKIYNISRYKGKYKRNALIIFVYAFLFMILSLIGIILSVSLKTEFLVTVDGKIVEVYEQKNYHNDHYVFKFENDDGKDFEYRLGVHDFSLLQKNGLDNGVEIKIVYPKIREMEDKIDVIEVYEKDFTPVFSNLQMERTSFNVMVGIGAPLSIILTLIGSYTIWKHYQAKNKKDEMTQLEVMGLYSNDVSLFFDVEDNIISKKRKSFFRHFFSWILVCLLETVLGIEICVMSFQDGYYALIPLTIIFVVLTSLIAEFVLVKRSPYRYGYKKQNEIIEEIKKVYKKHLYEDVSSEYFKKDGVYIPLGSRVIDSKGKEEQERVFIPYEQCNFYCAAIYSNALECVKILICTDFRSDVDMEQDYMEIMSYKTYAAIQKYHVHVEGLNYLLNHIEEETEKYTSKVEDYKVVSYQNK